MAVHRRVLTLSMHLHPHTLQTYRRRHSTTGPHIHLWICTGRPGVTSLQPIHLRRIPIPGTLPTRPQCPGVFDVRCGSALASGSEVFIIWTSSATRQCLRHETMALTGPIRGQCNALHIQSIHRCHGERYV
ncbi:MAG: hypothetical protein CM15mP92_2590 [Halieaceae bacterium]|nr:MAG: hypothetical protein CM15mP92_2590 [Halieaceae bacterium]